jgi:phage terminase Nu1 subunit (DNA packaging protein)
MTEPDREVTAAELADLLGLSGAALREHASRGVVTRSGRGRYRLRESVRSYCERLRRAHATRVGSPTAAARGRLLEAQGEHARLKNARLSGALVDAEPVQAEWAGVLTRLRGRLLAIPSRLSYLSRRDLELVDAELRAALEELASGGEAAAEADEETAAHPPS